DYAWDRPLDLQDDSSIDFQDGWQAIVSAAGDGAIEMQGSAADELKRWAKTPVAFLPADVFIQAALQGDVYYTLIGARSSLFAPQSTTGFDVPGRFDPAQGTALFRTKYGSLSRATRLAPSNSGGYFWLLEPGVATQGSELPQTFGGGEALFNLPNGLLGYAVINASGTRLAELPIGLVDSPGWSTGAVVGAGCQGCHIAGVLPVLNEVAGGADVAPLVDRDNAAYLQTLDQLETRRSAVAQMFADFQLAPITPRIAAADLGVSPGQLMNALDRLDPRLAPLGIPDGFIERDTFLAAYRTSLCVLQEGAETAPLNCEIR
ncbi:MAG TPA: hypothetical protein VJU61_08780, partial [Polyangiaceae bacterium]|nr:hypothetical protein [Polyangiaceae bacterium]